MQTLRKEQLKANESCGLCLSLLVILFVFSAPVMNTVLIIIGRPNQSGQLAFVYILCTVALLLYMIFNKIHIITKSTCEFFFLPILLLFWFEYTRTSYNDFNAAFNSEMRSTLAIWPATMLIGILLQYKECKPIDKRAIVVANAILTFLAVYGVFFSNGITTGGLQRDESGLLYQNISYYAAFSIGMTSYLYEETENVSRKKALILLMTLQFALCCVAGGRGGVVLATVFVFVFLLSKYKFKILYFVIPISIFIVALPYIINALGKRIGLNMTGFNRILSFVYGASTHDSGRQALWRKAWEMFATFPSFGHGLGSTIYEMNSYSHNMFMDLLAETGIAGTVLFIIVLFIFMSKAITYYKKSALCRWMTIIFISGFTMNLFSGYVWANQMFWIPIITVLGFNQVTGQYK